MVTNSVGCFLFKGDIIIFKRGLGQGKMEGEGRKRRKLIHTVPYEITTFKGET